MVNPTPLKENVRYTEAYEIIDYLYGHMIDIKTETDDFNNHRIRGFYEGQLVINYNDSYGVIMISNDFLKGVK